MSQGWEKRHKLALIGRKSLEFWMVRDDNVFAPTELLIWSQPRKGYAMDWILWCISDNFLLLVFWIFHFGTKYSVCSLVWARMEEQTSGTIVAKKIKWPSKRGQEGPSYCPKSSKLSYDHFGGRREQSNPPPRLHRAAAARLLSRSDKYKSLYKRIILTSIFVEYNDLYLSEQLSSRAAAARWRRGGGLLCSSRPPKWS